MAGVLRRRALHIITVVAVVGSAAFVAVGASDAASIDSATLTLSQRAAPLGSTQPITATVSASVEGVAENGATATFSGGVVFNTTHCTTVSGTCSVTFTPGSTSGTTSIAVTVTNTGFSAPASQPFTQYGPAANVALQLQYGRLTPDGVDTTSATATVTDSSGTPVYNAAVGFQTDASQDPVTFSAVMPGSAPGSYQVTVTAPSQVPPGSSYAMVAAQSMTQTITASTGTVSGSQPLQLAYPTFSTVQYPGSQTIGSQAPGLYDDRGRIKVQGSEAETVSETPLGSTLVPDLIKHMGNGAVTKPGDSYDTWDFNIVRIQLDEADWLDSACSNNYTPVSGQSYQQVVDSTVQQITENGMIADLDLQWSDEPTPSTPTCAAHNAGYADEGAPAFWASVAARYGVSSSAQYNPMVAFDLYNEPMFGFPGTSTGGVYVVNAGNDPVQDWMNGGTTSAGQSFVGMQALYTAVRSTAGDSVNPVIVSGIGPALCNSANGSTDGSHWGFDLSPVVVGDRASADNGSCSSGTSTPVMVTSDGQAFNGSNWGTNVIYSSHPYWSGTAGVGEDCSDSTSQSDGDNSANIKNANDQGDLDALIGPVAARFPVIFGEIGYACSDATLGNNAATYDLTWAASHGVGWVIFIFERNWMNPATSPPGWGILQCDNTWCNGNSTNGYEPFAPYDNGVYVHTTSLGTTTQLW